MFPVSCLEVKTNGTAKEEPAPAPEAIRSVEKETPAPVVTPQHAPPPPPPERSNEKEKEKVDRDKSGGMFQTIFTPKLLFNFPPKLYHTRSVCFNNKYRLTSVS